MMKFFARIVGYVTTATALGTALFSFAGTWFGEKGSALQSARDLVFEMRRTQALRYRSEVVLQSLEAKTCIIVDLMEGRLRLREAIDRFQKLNKELIENLARRDVDQGMIPAYVPPTIDPEIIGRQILKEVRLDVVIWPPDKANHLLADLESEFRELFGRASLPDSSMDTALTHQDVGWNREHQCVPR